MLEQIRIPEADYGTIHEQVCAHYGLDPTETYTVLGARSAESNRRRDGLKKVGTAYNDEFGTASVIWDWRQQHADEIIARHGLQLPADCDLFLLRDEETGRLARRGRSFDGIDAFFTRRWPRPALTIGRWCSAGSRSPDSTICAAPPAGNPATATARCR